LSQCYSVKKTKRKRNHSKRAKLNSQGFKVRKGTRVYIGKETQGGWSRSGKPAPRPEIVEMSKGMFLNDSDIKKMNKHIKEISIVYQKTNKYVGFWNSEKQKLTIIDDRIQTVTEFRSTFCHEVKGHTFWDFSRKWRREELIAFNKVANELPPISTYVRKNETEWKKMNDETDDQKQFEKSIEHIPEWDASEKLMQEYQEKQDAFNEKRKTNGHDTMTRYANEQHSAIAEIVNGFGGHKTLLNEKDVQRLVELYERLHY